MIKIQVLNRLFTKNLRSLNRNTFSFVPDVCYFSYLPRIAASEDRSLTTLFSTQMRGEEIQAQEYQHPCPILLGFWHSSSPICKNYKKPEVDKNSNMQDTFTLTGDLYFPRTDAQNSQYLVY